MKRPKEIPEAVESYGRLLEKKIPLFAGRPLREKIISKDDILNLQIALNASQGWDEFLSRL